MQETSDPFEIPTQELFTTPEGLNITVTKDIDPAEFDVLWGIVEDGFQELNRKSYEKQDMTREELEADLKSPRVLKYVARDADKGLVGLLTVHIGLEDISWSDVSDLEKAQDKTDPAAKPYYVGTIVVPPSERGTNAASSLIRGALLHFGQVNDAKGYESLVFFDCAEANYPWLGQFIQEVGSPSEQFPDLKTQVTELYADSWVDNGDEIIKTRRSINEPVPDTMVDQQHYYAISIERQKSITVVP